MEEDLHDLPTTSLAADDGETQTQLHSRSVHPPMSVDDLSENDYLALQKEEDAFLSMAKWSQTDFLMCPTHLLPTTAFNLEYVGARNLLDQAISKSLQQLYTFIVPVQLTVLSLGGTMMQKQGMSGW